MKRRQFIRAALGSAAALALPLPKTPEPFDVQKFIDWYFEQPEVKEEFERELARQYLGPEPLELPPMSPECFEALQDWKKSVGLT